MDAKSEHQTLRGGLEFQVCLESPWFSKKRVAPGKIYQASTPSINNCDTNVSYENKKRNRKHSKVNKCGQIRQNLLLCALINARSVGNKAPNNIEFITENNLDILVITETWLFSEEIAKLKAITPGGYESYSAPRDARNGGGVAIICRNVLKCKVKEFKVVHIEKMLKKVNFRDILLLIFFEFNSRTSFCEIFLLHK